MPSLLKYLVDKDEVEAAIRKTEEAKTRLPQIVKRNVDLVFAAKMKGRELTETEQEEIKKIKEKYKEKYNKKHQERLDREILVLRHILEEANAA